LETSARTGAGIDAWIDLLVDRRAAMNTGDLQRSEACV
jgi:hypothetical protein